MYEMNASATDCYSLYQEIVNRSLESELCKLKIENDNLRNKLAEATDIIKKIDKYIIPHHGWTKSEREEQVELVKHAKKFLQENNLNLKENTTK